MSIFVCCAAFCFADVSLSHVACMAFISEGMQPESRNQYEAQPEALRDAGIAFATEQIVDLLAHGVDGIHLYTMNNPYIARKISETVRTLL